MRRSAARRSTRHIVIAGVLLFASAGAVLVYVMPMVSSADAWFAAADGTATTGMLLGLMFALTGTTVVRSLGIDRRRSHAQHSRPRQPEGSTAAAISSPVPQLDGGGRGQAPLSAAMPQPLSLHADAQLQQLCELSDSSDRASEPPHLLGHQLSMIGDPR